jgi:hypothetical protein
MKTMSLPIQKSAATTNFEFSSKTCVGVDSEIGSDPCVAIDSKIGSDGGVVFFWVFIKKGIDILSKKASKQTSIS